MSADINLLLRKDEESLKRQQRAKTFTIAALMSLVGVGVLSLLSFLLIQTINPPSLKKEQDDVLRKMSQFQSRQAKLLAVNNRISNIQAIFQKRKNLSQVVNALLAKIPDKLLIQNMEVNDKVVLMSASSTSLFAIGQFINNLTDMVRKKEVISSLTLNSLVFDDTKNNYQLSTISDL